MNIFNHGEHYDEPYFYMQCALQAMFVCVFETENLNNRLLAVYLPCYHISRSQKLHWLDLIAARSKAWVCGRSLPGIVGFNPNGGMDVCLL
jgi:hypothetical protein